MTSLARLFTLLTTIERRFGLSSLEKGEREILTLIVTAIGNNEEISAETVVEQVQASRATVYRRIATLKQIGLIEAYEKKGRSIFRLGGNFRKHFSELDAAIMSKHESH
jgi:predicted transcriptional regulator